MNAVKTNKWRCCKAARPHNYCTTLFAMFIVQKRGFSKVVILIKHFCCISVYRFHFPVHTQAYPSPDSAPQSANMVCFASSSALIWRSMSAWFTPYQLLSALWAVIAFAARHKATAGALDPYRPFGPIFSICGLVAYNPFIHYTFGSLRSP